MNDRLRMLTPLLALAWLTMVFVSCGSDDDENDSSRQNAQYSAQVWQYLNKANERENLDEAGRKGYEAHEWRLEVKNAAVPNPQSPLK